MIRKLLITQVIVKAVILKTKQTPKMSKLLLLRVYKKLHNLSPVEAGKIKAGMLVEQVVMLVVVKVNKAKGGGGGGIVSD